MSRTINDEATMRAYVEAFNLGEFDRIRTLFTPDARIHGVIGSATLERAVAFWEQLHNGLNCKLEVVDLCNEGDVVVAR